jgi:hypothetical protein
MIRLFFVLCLILPSYAMAQDVAANKPAKPAVKEEKPKPVILEQAKLQELRLVTLEQENLQLKLQQLQAQAERLQADAKKADEAITAFWKTVGINRAELATKWEASNGVNGAIILTPKADAKEEKPKAQ